VEALLPYWHWIAGAAAFILQVYAFIHVVLSRREAQSAIGWVGLIWFAPVAGSTLYFLFGINRIRRRARRLRKHRSRPKPVVSSPPDPVDALTAIVKPEIAHLIPLAHLIGVITERTPALGNRIQPLHNGDQAYPAMLEAIEQARQSIALSTYIFQNDRAGNRFVDALARAVARGVEVRVLIDDIGVRYCWPRIISPLRHAGVPVRRFLPKLLFWHFTYANLCNHRKLLIVDGRMAFTGGMNISEGNDLTLSPRHPIQDLHFQIDGPVVAQLQEVFVEDWEFSAGELLHGHRWFPDLEARGAVLARGISSGPDADLEKLRLAFHGALACARTRVMIVTPYFVPDPTLISALCIAAMRGVQVDILLPSHNNLQMVHWASMTPVMEVLEHGCHVWLTPGFSHTKLMLVDGVWTLLGSGNWDARSLRLNFEFDLECYDGELTSELERAMLRTLEAARPLTLAELHRRPFLVKLRDGIARLWSPYL
jgi:cardiolipin synthase